jgi:hypothetical protein
MKTCFDCGVDDISYKYDDAGTIYHVCIECYLRLIASSISSDLEEIEYIKKEIMGLEKNFDDVIGELRKTSDLLHNLKLPDNHK